MKINTLKEQLFSITEKFASKTGDYAQITRLMMEIKGCETKISSNAEKLGLYIYDRLSTSSIEPDETTTEYCEKISNLKTKIDLHTKEIETIKQHAVTQTEPQENKPTEQTDQPSQQEDTDQVANQDKV